MKVLIKMNRFLFCALAGFAGMVGSLPGDPAEKPVVTRSVPGSPFRTAVSSATMVWDNVTKMTSVVAGESTANFRFNFTNVSSSSVTILNVHPSCGCTTAQLPPLPWKIESGGSGQIGIKVNLAGKSGTLVKTVNISTDKGSQMLSVKISILSAESKPVMFDSDRAHGLAIAQVDRQAVFQGDCAGCHRKPGEGKSGQALYAADCGICHEGEHRASMVPDLHAIPQSTSPEFWQTWIAYGRPHSLMPAFARSEGGPLTDAQVASLVAYLSAAISAKIPGK